MLRGVVLPQHEVAPDVVLDAARLAERSGLDSVWFVDHLQGRPSAARPFLEAWTTAAAVAQVTERVTVGLLVMRVGVRLPLLVATMAATAHSVSKGRFVLGIGAGDSSVKQEHHAFGIPYRKRAARLASLTDTIAAVKSEAPGVKVWVGGMSDDVIARATDADAWNMWGDVERFVALAPKVSTALPNLEVTWAGSFPGEEGLRALAVAGAAHAVVATGVNNYEERIEQMSRR